MAMANRKHLDILKQGIEVWNDWRETNPRIQPDLRGVDLQGLDLREVNFTRANLSKANLTATRLFAANLCEANLSKAKFEHADLGGAELSKANINGVNFSRARIYHGTSFTEAYGESAFDEVNAGGIPFVAGDKTLQPAKFIRARLHKASFWKAELTGANFSGANLSKADVSEAFLNNVNLTGANLREADCFLTFLQGADLSRADLRKANLSYANLSEAILRDADLNEANLAQAQFVGTSFENAILSSCRIYGVSAWDLKLKNTQQLDLVITPENAPVVTVDNLEVAQFIYLLLNNEKIRDVIDTVGKKAVLILGRFTKKRKVVLDSLRNELRNRGFLPILFDFDKPPGRNLTETVSTLAHLARFIIADLTDAKSIPQELQHIVPSLPSVPVQPLLLSSQREYAMFKDFLDFPSVLMPHRYESLKDLLDSLGKKVIAPAEAKAQEIEKRRRILEKSMAR
jgi:uncharacterized protein YjbI with pentapeptide repeats